MAPTRAGLRGTALKTPGETLKRSGCKKRRPHGRRFAKNLRTNKRKMGRGGEESSAVARHTHS
jgi:hypothetical protein